MFENARAILAMMLAEGLSPADCLRLEIPPEEAHELLQSHTGRRRLTDLLGRNVGVVDFDELDRQCAAAERVGAAMTTWWDTDYPDALREIAEPPPLIFYRGDITALERRGVGIVGTRKPTPGGVAFARRLGRELSLAGVPVISGLARGIDTAAHAGSLGGPGAAVAVIGTGIDVVYPQENAELMVDIARSGCVMTEQLMGRTPTAFVFPRRNRMISGLARAVVVVEGGIKSGALITARWALEQGRDVGAVPCFPGDFRSEGPNSLIKQGAFVVEGAGDVLSAVNGLAQTVLSFDEAGDEKPRGVAAHVRRIYDSLGRTPTDLDALAETVGVAVEAVQSVLTEMEIEGLVRRDAAGRYCREG